MKIIVFLSVIALAAGVKVKSQHNPITQQNTDLFKYSPNDIYSLPEDIDDDSDKAPVIYNGDSKNAKVFKLENINSGRGKFKVSLKTENGIELNQAGKLKDEKTFVISGSYTYTGADGKRYRVRYTADELGYHPITELDLEIPDEKQPSATASKLNGLGAGLDKNNGFQFLKRPIGGGNAGTQGNAETFGNQGSSSNTVVHQKGQGYSFESSGAPLGGLTAPGYGSLGSASVQSTVVKGGSSTLSSLGHGSQSAGNGVASQGSSFGSAGSQGSLGNSGHGSSSFGSVASHGSSVSGAYNSGSFGSGANGGHGSSSFGSVASHGSSGNGVHGSSAFGSVASHGSSGNSAHGSSAFGSVASHGSSGNSAHGGVASQGSLGGGAHSSTSFGANGAHGSGVSSFSSVSKGPQTASSFGSVSKGPQTVSSFGSVSKGPQTASTFATVSKAPQSGASSFGSVSKGPQTASSFGSVSKGPQTASSFGSVSKGPQTVSTFGSVSKGPQTASTFATLSKGPQGGSGVSVSGGSFAGNAGQGGFSSGHVSVSTGSGNDRKTSASHQVETYESGLNTDVFAQIEHHSEDGYNYVPPNNQYLPPASHPIGH